MNFPASSRSKNSEYILKVSKKRLMKEIMDNTKKGNNIVQIQFLKFCAFVMIFLYHVRSYLPANDYINGLGVFAVSFFIICSGFTTGWVRIDQPIREVSAKNIISDLKNKVVKFYPLYFTSVFFGIIMTDMPRYISLHYFEGLPEYCSQLALTVTMLQSWVNNGDYYMFNPVCWYISSTLFLYCFNVPLIAFFNKQKDNTRNLICCCVTSLILIVVYSFLISLITDDVYWVYIFPPARLGEYAFGMSLGVIVRKLTRQNSFSNISKRTGTLLEILAIVLWIGVIFTPKPAWASATAVWAIPNAVLLVIFTMGSGKLSDLFCAKVPCRLGQISTECFFIHYLIITACLWLAGLGVASKLGCLFMVTYDFILTILISLQLNKAR